MYEQTAADKIWNRACQGGGDCPRSGDSALTALLRFHGAAMNGGVLHAIEYLSPDELVSAQSGYRFFGFGIIADLIATASKALIRDQDLDSLEESLDLDYHAAIPVDATLALAFEEYFKSFPNNFALLASANLTGP